MSDKQIRHIPEPSDNYFAVEVDKLKYRQQNETLKQKCGRIADTLSDDPQHDRRFYVALRDQYFAPGGRVQAATGALRAVTAFNCFVMNTIPDSMEGIMKTLSEAAETMRRGGGVGYDFSTLRPKNSKIHSLDSTASGPVSFMEVFNAMCGTIMSAGHRRGAQMACMRVDHPDIQEFITSKMNHHRFNNFNISVLVTDEFMEALKSGGTFDLKFNGEVYDTVSARALWDIIMRANFDWAEPGVIFIDRINRLNNLYYCETISATNPCGEQPLPPYGACLLGSYNLTKFIKVDDNGKVYFDYGHFTSIIPDVVRAMDNVIDTTIYPLPEQEQEAKNKRRMGLGVTGVANALGALDIRYGSDEAVEWLENVMWLKANTEYQASALLAKEKGTFPLYDAEKYLAGEYIQSLMPETQSLIKQYGIRNSHLGSVAPTGTISLYMGNISSGIEPVFSLTQKRKVFMENGQIDVELNDYAYENWGIECPTVQSVTAEEHVKMLCAAQKWIDSAVSKTCNVGDHVTFPEFKEIYMQAYDGGAKGCTTFRAAGERFGIMEDTSTEEETKEEETVTEGAACFIDPATGQRSCE